MNLVTFTFYNELLMDILKKIQTQEMILNLTEKVDELPINTIASFIFNNIPLPKIIACQAKNIFSNCNTNKLVVITGERFLHPLYKFYIGDIKLNTEDLNWFYREDIHISHNSSLYDLPKNMYREFLRATLDIALLNPPLTYFIDDDFINYIKKLYI